MSMLIYYTKRVVETRGLEHQACLSYLREYIKHTKTDDLISHIGDIGSAAFLRALWEAGLTTELQDAVLKKYEELTERRG